MTRSCVLVVALSCAVLASPLLCASDLSSYREFKLGSALPAVARQVKMEPSQARVIHSRPALIQVLDWRPQSLGPSTRPESAGAVLFSFYNGELHRIVVTYDNRTTEGLTTQDLMDAISATYGAASIEGAGIVLPSIYGGDETLAVLARWEDAEYAINLVRFDGQPNFTLVAFSKRLDALARTAAAEAVRLDAQEAPQKEVDSQIRLAEEYRVRQEKARIANKPAFRP